MNVILKTWDPNTSPLFSFLSEVVSSVANIAPEHRAELDALAPRVRFVIDDEPGFIFRARGAVDPREVRSSIVGLEFLWCLSFAHLSIYQAADRIGAPARVSGSNTANFDKAAEMLTFAFTDRMGPQHPEHTLPKEFPVPEFARLEFPAEVGDVHMATEVFLCAVA
jgi:hypothetical protein